MDLAVCTHVNRLDHQIMWVALWMMVIATWTKGPTNTATQPHLVQQHAVHSLTLRCNTMAGAHVEMLTVQQTSTVRLRTRTAEVLALLRQLDVAVVAGAMQSTMSPQPALQALLVPLVHQEPRVPRVPKVPRGPRVPKALLVQEVLRERKALLETMVHRVRLVHEESRDHRVPPERKDPQVWQVHKVQLAQLVLGVSMVLQELLDSRASKVSKARQALEANAVSTVKWARRVHQALRASVDLRANKVPRVRRERRARGEREALLVRKAITVLLVSMEPKALLARQVHQASQVPMARQAR